MKLSTCECFIFTISIKGEVVRKLIVLLVKFGICNELVTKNSCANHNSFFIASLKQATKDFSWPLLSKCSLRAVSKCNCICFLNSTI